MNRLLGSFCVILLACESLSFVNIANAQSAPTTRPNPTSQKTSGASRYTGGWQVSPRSVQPDVTPTQNPRSAQAQAAMVQSAFFQSPGTELGLPTYPNANASANNFANDNFANDNFANDNVGAPPLPLPSGMSSALPGGRSVSLSDAAIPNYTPAAYDNQPYNPAITPPPQPQAYDPYARQQPQVLPPQSQPSVSPYRTVSTADNNLRAVQNNNPQNAYSPGNDLRPVTPTMPSGFGPNAQRIEVATGYPFVSPAPRTGNYPTSPYNASLYRTVAFQNTVQSPQAPLSAAVGNTQPTLPQFQTAPAVGVYPTQYPCTPGAATFPPPGAVPGNYVPPTLTPNLTPGTYSPNNSGYSPFFSLGQENYNVQIGRGIIGQPTVYVPGQPIRNFIRYLSP